MSRLLKAVSENREMYLVDLATCMAESNEPFCQGFGRNTWEKSSRNLRSVAGIPWQGRERLFEAPNPICRRKPFRWVDFLRAYRFEQ